MASYFFRAMANGYYITVSAYNSENVHVAFNCVPERTGICSDPTTGSFVEEYFRCSTGRLFTCAKLKQ